MELAPSVERMAAPIWIQRARQAAWEAFQAVEVSPEIERLLVSGAVVAREGDHYRIESGDEDAKELEHVHHRAAGLCDCGRPLSSRDTVHRCRACGREFRLA